MNALVRVLDVLYGGRLTIIKRNKSTAACCVERHRWTMDIQEAIEGAR